MRNNDQVEAGEPGCSAADPHTRPAEPRRMSGASLARITLTAFLLTFMCTRALVYLIMSRTIPDLYVHLGGTHVHHLNYGIFILSGLGGYLLFAPPQGRRLRGAAIAYGIGLALTFDEFGMWLHLGGGYWQRASFDAIVVIAGLLGLIASASFLKRYRPRHWATLTLLVVTLAAFTVLFIDSFNYAGHRFGPRFEQMERRAPQ
jgi:hypothetical protein